MKLEHKADVRQPGERALVVVHPNNPTGSFVSREDREKLVRFASSRKIALVVDEVFLDFPLSPGIDAASFAGESFGLVFVLSGLSKLAGLPQMKLAWIAVSGDADAVDAAAARLELIGDTYLSVGAQVALAAPRILEIAPRRGALVSERVRANVKTAIEEVARSEPVSILPSGGPEGGWSLLLRLPAVCTSDEWAIRALEETSVYAHPGSFFGFATEAILVLSRMQLSMVSSPMVALVTVIGVATVVHVAMRFREDREALPPPEALRATFIHLGPAIFWTCLTTAAGFASLLACRIVPVAGFGVMMALGSLLVFVAVLGLTPASVLVGGRHTDPLKAPGEDQVAGVLARMIGVVERRPWPVAIGGVLVLLVATLGTTRLEVATDFDENFRKSSRIVQSYRFLTERM